MNKLTDPYAEAVAAGIQTDSHRSDLYLPDCPEVREILKRYKESGAGPSSLFRSNLDGKLWWEVPFAFTPFWEARQSRRANR